jgi:hypothetical protein
MPPNILPLTPPTPRLTTTQTTDRTKRVKESRDEAKKEIEAYRAKKEAEFKKFEAEVPFCSASYRYNPGVYTLLTAPATAHPRQ